MRKFTVENVKRLLKSRRIIEAELLLTQAKMHGHLELDIPEEMKAKKLELERKLKHIDSLFKVLSQDEDFVIRRHLIDGIDWFRIAKEQTDVWGKESEKSMRTYQMNQANGLKKIAAFINEGDNRELFLSMLLSG